MRRLAVALVLVLTAFGTALGAQAPGDGLAAQNLRPYWHVFAAYAIAWLLIGGWIISMVRRLGAVERRNGD